VAQILNDSRHKPQLTNKHRDHSSSRSFQFAKAAPRVSMRMPKSRASLPLSRASSFSGCRCLRLGCKGRDNLRFCLGGSILLIHHTLCALSYLLPSRVLSLHSRTRVRTLSFAVWLFAQYLSTASEQKSAKGFSLFVDKGWDSGKLVILSPHISLR